jgi:hypothetical protein
MAISHTSPAVAEQHMMEQLQATILSLEEALERGEQERTALVRTIATLNTSAMTAALKHHQQVDGKHERHSPFKVANAHVDPFGPHAESSHDPHRTMTGSNPNGWKLTYRVEDETENVTVAAFKQMLIDNRAYKIEIEQLQRAARRWHSEVEQKERLWQKRLTEANESASAFQQKCRSLELELRTLQAKKSNKLR